MVEVEIRRTASSFAMTCQNHAGTEALCAAVSTLLFTLAGCMRNEQGVYIDAERLEPGDAQLTYRFSRSGALRRRQEAICDEIAVGFLQLQASLPRDIRVLIIGGKSFRQGGVSLEKV